MHACMHAWLSCGDWHEHVLWGIHIGFTFSVAHYLVHRDFLQTVMWHQILLDSYMHYIESIPYY